MAFAYSPPSAAFFSPAVSTSSPSETRREHGHLLLPPLRAALTPTRLRPPPRASSSRRFQEAVVVVPDPRNWREIRALNEEEDYDSDGEDDDDDEDDDDRSLDLLVRFLHNVFRKVSRRVRKAVRSVLPVPISTKLVGFSVDGVLILAFLWILKAFLEVVCTLGSTVFVSILLVRGIWSGVSYIQETRYDKRNRFDNDDRAWSGVQAAT